MLVNVIDPTLQGQLITIDAVRTVSKYTKIAVIVDKKGHTYCARFRDNRGVEFDAGDEKRPRPHRFGIPKIRKPIEAIYPDGRAKTYPSIRRAASDFEASADFIAKHVNGQPIKSLGGVIFRKAVNENESND